MTTEVQSIRDRSTAVPPRADRRRAAPGTDRLTVVLFSVACFLAVLALLSSRMHAPATRRAPVVVLRKIYRTTVITTITGGAGPDRRSVAQSVSGSGAPPVAAPTTRTS